MLDYEIKPIDISDASVRNQIAELAGIAFKATYSQDKIPLNTDTKSSIAPTLYLGAFQDRDLIGFTCFMSHDLIYNAKIVNCYQVSWAMVHPRQEGKMIFPNLVNNAKKLLREQGAGFMFAYPSANTYQIMVKLLRFRPEPIVKVNVPAISLLAGNYFAPWNEDKDSLFKDVYLQNDEQLIKLKKGEYGNEIKVIDQDCNNLIWGRVRSRKVGPLNVRYFTVGGMTIHDPLHIVELFYKLIKQQRVLFVQFLFNQSNRYVRLFRKVENANQAEPFIVFDLNTATSSKTAFCFMSGIRDIF